MNLETEKIELAEKEVEKAFPKVEKIKAELRKTIVGQENLLEKLILALFSDGHILLEGVPGLAKTLSVSTLAKIVNASFKRIQFTPDLLPADLLGTRIFSPKTSEFSIKKGPVFANIILADEINRAPAKVQSALLEAMQERQVTIGEESFQLPKPFLVLATQNPVEQEGTFPLPEAQIDRFMLKVKLDYPSQEEEMDIISLVTEKEEAKIEKVISPKEIIQIREVVKQIHVSQKIKQYVVDIISASRNPGKFDIKNIKNFVEFGASPRGSINLILAARTNAFLNQRAFVIPDDVKETALEVLRHRVTPTFEALADGSSADDIVKNILENVKVP